MTAYITGQVLDIGTLTSDTSTTGIVTEPRAYIATIENNNGTGVAKLQTLRSGSAVWVDITSATVTDASKRFEIVMGQDEQIRMNLTSSAGSPSFTGTLSPTVLGA